MAIIDLQNQASGLQGQINDYQSLINQPGISENYKLHAQQAMGDLQSQLNALLQEIAILITAQGNADAAAQRAAEEAAQRAREEEALRLRQAEEADRIRREQELTQKQTQVIPVDAVYTGESSRLGGTWGNTPGTLAQQQISGNQIKYIITDNTGKQREATESEAKKITEQAIANLTDTQKKEYETTLKKLETGVSGNIFSVTESLTGKMNPSEVEQVQKDLINIIPKTIQNISGDTLKVTSEPNIQVVSSPDLISLKSGEMVDKETFNQLTKEEQEILKKEGLDGLEKYIKQQEETAQAENKEAIRDTQASLEQIKSKQQTYENQSLWDKVQQTLNTPVTFKEVVQETLTFGGAQTKAFDKDKIDKEWHESRLSALKNGADIAVSKEDYEKDVLSKQATAEELGMQFVPFEYVRPGRWDQLQLWEKVVYPALDIVTLVPVIGLGAKGVSALAKSGSTAARIASLGGKSAVEFAAKDAALQVEKATTQKLVKEGLLAATKEAIATSTDPVQKKVLNSVLKDAVKDVKTASKEYQQIVKNASELEKMNQVTTKIASSPPKIYKASEATEKGIRRVSKYTEPVDVAGGTGVIGYSTVANWNDSTPEQRAVGLGLAALSSGMVGKGLNIAENIVDPYKIPIAALKPRAARTEAIEGKIFNAEKSKGIVGTTRLVLDHTMKPEDARMTVAELQKKLTAGERNAKAQLETTEGMKEIKAKGTGFQAVVGKTSLSASPMGEIFKGGTGATGAKSNLEKALERANKKYGTNIEIESKPLKIGDAEIEVKTISMPGVTVKGAEGGMYLGSSLYNQFAHKAAFGAGGKISSGILVNIPGISELPKGIKNIDDIKRMEKVAIKQFDGTNNINKEVEGFKKYAKFMEFENVITNGSQLERVQNLRSKLADNLHLNKGEYYTRDPQGKIELFNMYLEGGKVTPYNLKQLYKLKGLALQNSLEDLFFGLEKKIDDLKQGKLMSHKEVDVITKEEQLAKAFNDIDETVKRKGMSNTEAKRLKNEIISEYRSRIEYTPNRTALRSKIAALATRSEAQRRTDDKRTQDFVNRVRADRQAIKDRLVGRITPESRAREPLRETPRIKEQPHTRETLRETRIAERTQPRESARETPREQMRESLRDTPRTKEQPRIDTRVNETPRETPRTTIEIRESLRNTPETRETIRATPEIRRPVGDISKIKPVLTFVNKEFPDKKITNEQIEGAIAWKQGMFYRMHYPPFGQEDKIVTRDPIPEVPYHDGIGSAAKSMVTLYGEIPHDVKLDMGIVDIGIFRGKDIKHPEMKFKGDPKQKTNYSKQGIRNT